MQAHKMVLDGIVDQAYTLIAIHSSVEEYKLAFLLNKNLGLHLSRSRTDIDLFQKSFSVLFILYQFYDRSEYTSFYLMSNKSIKKSELSPATGTLFGEEEIPSNNVFLVPEYSKVDFFLKISCESEINNEKILLEKIKQISQVSTAYLVDPKKLKSKENLIFE